MPRATKIFSKSLTATDTKKRLAIPSKILPDLPDFNGGHAVKIYLIYGTKEWPIICSVRKNGYKKPVFSGGWRDFVVCNNFRVGDRFTLYKVHDEEGSSHYRVEVERPARPSGELPTCAVSLNHDGDDQTTVTSLTQVCNFEDEQEQQIKVADAPVKEEGGAIMELADVVADEPVPFVDNIISKPSCWIFGTNLSDEATGKAHFKTEQETEIKFITKAICMGEPPLDSCPLKTEIKFFGLAETGAMAYGTSQAAGEACIEMLGLDLVERQATQYVREVNLNLTLGLSNVDGGEQSDKSPVFCSFKTMV